MACLAAAALLLAGCTSDSGGETNSTTQPQPSTGTSSLPATSTPDETEETRTNAEQALLALLGGLGVKNPGVPEHGFKDAWASGSWTDRTIVVHSSPSDTAAALGKTLSETSIAGTKTVMHANPSFGVTARFTCDKTVYDVSSIDSIDDPRTGNQKSELTFVGKMLGELNCP